MAIYIRNIVDRSKLVTYDQLNNDAKVLARREILDEWHTAYAAYKTKAACLARKDINKIINNPPHRHLLQVKAVINTLTNSIKKLEGHIEENLCRFLPDGTYVYFMKREGDK